MNCKTFISVTDFAAMLGVSTMSAYRLARQADFYPAVRIGKRILVDVDLFTEWQKGQHPDGAKEAR